MTKRLGTAVSEVRWSRHNVDGIVNHITRHLQPNVSAVTKSQRGMIEWLRGKWYINLCSIADIYTSIRKRWLDVPLNSRYSEA